MFERFFDLVTSVVTLSKELQQNREEIKEIRKDIQQLTIIVNRLASDMEHNKELEAQKRETLIAELRNALLVFQKRLPLGGSPARSQP